MSLSFHSAPHTAPVEAMSVCVSTVHVGVPRPLNDAQPSRDSLEVGSGSHRTRVNSHFMRELTHGQFIINHEQLTLLENVGQGDLNYILIGQGDLNYILNLRLLGLRLGS